MSQKKIRFKERIKRNDQKARHKVASGMRKRMGVTRRTHNKYDHVDTDSRPMEVIMADIAEGSAIPTQEFGLDPRGLTDLLLQPSPASSAAQSSLPTHGKTERSSPSSITAGPPVGAAAAAAPPPRSKPQLPTALPADHPLAALDTSAVEAEERRRREEQEAMLARQSSKNQYRHAGQPYVFWERIGLHPAILKALRALRFSHPTPVQQEVLSHVMDPSAGVASPEKRKKEETAEEDEDEAGGAAAATGEEGQRRRKKRKGRGGVGSTQPNTARDVVVSAETGSGKTLVFAIPVLDNLLKHLDAVAAAAGKSIPLPTTVAARTPSSHSAESERDEGKGSEGGTGKKTKKRPRSGDAMSAQGSDGAGKKRRKVERKEHVGSGGGSAAAVAAAASADHDDVYVENRRRRLMHALIVSPTRELALQIRDTFESLTKFCPHISVGCVLGGMAQEKQQRVLNRHPHILICTPGRLWDLVEKNEGCYLGHSISRRLHYVVLDEADKLLQSGRFEQLKGMLERIHSETLPAGFVQERAEGAEVGEPVLEAGHWDEEKRRFVPLPKEDKAAKGTEEARGSEEDGEGEGGEDGGEEEGQGLGKSRPLKKKDQPRPIPMPAEPAEKHRVITYVTSATLSLQTNYERRDFKSDKKIIRTTNADVMGKVLQQLEIKPSSANVFTLSPQVDVAAKINETFLRCPDKSKDLYLYYFLRTYQDDRTIIFVNAISMLRRLVKIIEALGISVVGLHASMQQRQRLKFIDKFKTGTTKVLVATDVASRGLDIDGLKYVLHFQVPRSTEAYIHRCGRTARCGGTGLSVLMVNAQEHVSFKKLMESLGRKESDMEQFALQPTVVHQLNAHLRIALQIDRLQKEIDKTKASDRWVDRMNKAAELDVDDMKDEETAETNREKAKAIKLLKKELALLQKKFTGSHGGKGAFRSGAYAIGAKQAEEKLRLRADRQTLKLKKAS